MSNYLSSDKGVSLYYSIIEIIEKYSLMEHYKKPNPSYTDLDLDRGICYLLSFLYGKYVTEDEQLQNEADCYLTYPWIQELSTKIIPYPNFQKDIEICIDCIREEMWEDLFRNEF